jgi:hypothetical protein
MSWNGLLGPLGCDLLVKTDWKLIVQILTFLAVIGGWYKVNELSARRDLQNEQRKLRISYQVEAFENLHKAAHGKDLEALEQAIAKVQLVGSKEQINLAMKIGNSLNTDAYNELTKDIRDKLRKELHLEPITEQIRYLKLEEKKK